MIMKLRNAKRIYETKLSRLILRPILNEDYVCEFLRKMTPLEIKKYLNEVKDQIKLEGISIRNINYYNKIYNALIMEREGIYQRIKEIGDDNDVFDYE